MCLLWLYYLMSKSDLARLSGTHKVKVQRRHNFQAVVVWNLTLVFYCKGWEIIGHVYPVSTNHKPVKVPSENRTPSSDPTFPWSYPSKNLTPGSPLGGWNYRAVSQTKLESRICFYTVYHFSSCSCTWYHLSNNCSSWKLNNPVVFSFFPP